MVHSSTRRATPKNTPGEVDRRRRFQALLGFLGFVLIANGLVGEKGLIESIKAHRQVRKLAGSIAELKRENARFREDAQRLRSDPRAIERVAREELGFISPGELLFIVKDLPPRPQRAR